MPLQDLALRSADALAARFGWLGRPFDAARLIAAASRREPDGRIEDPGLHAALDALLGAIAKEADLSLVGRLATGWDMRRFLTNLLRFSAEERAAPAILKEEVARPIFVAGLPRSGTTFLHRLLLEDPASRGPLVWETIAPYAPRRGRDRRIADVAAQLRAFTRLAPEFPALHPLSATSPQECSEISGHVFRSLRFDTTYHIPSYRGWLDRAGQAEGYRFHKRFLQHLQHQGRAAGRAAPRWVLKCPDHLFAIDCIRAVYPDARLVFVHRDPVKVLLSVARLTEVLRRPFTRHVDPAEIGRQESARWLEGTRRMSAIGDDAGLPEPVCHIHYLDLVTDPIRTVQGLYRHFGLDLAAPAEAAMARYIAARPNGGYAPHHYDFADHGLDAAVERARFRPYMVQFGVQPEQAPYPGQRVARSLPAMANQALR
ncbi:MAG: sulfotransferase [Rhodospirillales bacterium]|nr:sulfotransferase [Rhodospirillales bacterium]